MHDSQSIETILARLMPPALSQSAQDEIEEMLDGLAEVPAVEPSRWHWRRWWIGGGMVAAGVAAAWLIPMINVPQHAVVTKLLEKPDPGFVLVSESDRVESMTDEGWLEDADGGTMQAMRLNMVEQNILRDEETGMVMNISEPREEILLMPISTF